MRRFLDFLIIKTATLTGIPAKYIITAVMSLCAATAHFQQQFGWLTLIYVPIWALLYFAYREDESHLKTDKGEIAEFSQFIERIPEFIEAVGRMTGVTERVAASFVTDHTVELTRAYRVCSDVNHSLLSVASDVCRVEIDTAGAMIGPQVASGSYDRFTMAYFIIRSKPDSFKDLIEKSEKVMQNRFNSTK